MNVSAHSNEQVRWFHGIRCVLSWRCGYPVERGLVRLRGFGHGHSCPSLDACRNDLLDGKSSCCEFSHVFCNSVKSWGLIVEVDVGLVMIGGS